MIFKKQKDVVFLTPQTHMDDNLFLSTNDGRFWSAYLLHDKDIKKIEDGQTYLAEIPEKSNIKKIEKHIKDYIKGMKNTSEYRSYNDEGESKTIWTDKFNRQLASVIENNEGLYYDVRGDIALYIINHNGVNIVQCNKDSCDYIIPQIVKIDLNKKKL